MSGAGSKQRHSWTSATPRRKCPASAFHTTAASPMGRSTAKTAGAKATRLAWEKLTDALSSGDYSTAVSVLTSPIAAEVVRLDKTKFHRQALCLAIVLGEERSFKLRLQLGKDAESMVSIAPSAPSISNIFTLHGAVGFEIPPPTNPCFAPATIAAVLVGGWCQLGELLKNGADANTRMPLTKQTPLHLVGLVLCSNLFICTMTVFRERDQELAINEEKRMAETTYSKEEMELNMNPVRYMAVKLEEAGGRISARDANNRCPITSAIAAGQLHAAAELLNIFAPKHLNKMDLLRYVEEVITLESVSDRAKLKISTRSYVRIFAAVYLHWTKSCRDKPPSRPTSSSANEQVDEKILQLLTHSVRSRAPNCLIWLCFKFDAEAVYASIPANHKLPLPHLLLSHGFGMGFRALIEADVDLTQTDEQGLSFFYCACRDNDAESLRDFIFYASPPVSLLNTLVSQRDPIHGITALGYVVAWGYLGATEVLLSMCKQTGLQINPLLTRQQPISPHHLPVFSAVVHGYPEIVILLLKAGLRLDDSACIEHLQVASSRVMLEPDKTTETLTLLMCAASLGKPDMVDVLLRAGVSVRESPPGNKTFKNAVTMVLEHADMDEQLRGESPMGGSPRNVEPSIPGLGHKENAAFQTPIEGDSQQASLRGSRSFDEGTPIKAESASLASPENSASLEKWMCHWLYDDATPRFDCLLILLAWGASLTSQQMEKLDTLLDLLTDPLPEHEVMEIDFLERFVTKRIRQCTGCSLYGRWKRCACHQVWYCSETCQKQDWEKSHRQHCTWTGGG